MPGTFLQVDADAHRSVGEAFDVKGFPTIKFFPRGKVPSKWVCMRVSACLRLIASALAKISARACSSHYFHAISFKLVRCLGQGHAARFLPPQWLLVTLVFTQFSACRESVVDYNAARTAEGFLEYIKNALEASRD